MSYQPGTDGETPVLYNEGIVRPLIEIVKPDVYKALNLSANAVLNPISFMVQLVEGKNTFIKVFIIITINWPTRLNFLVQEYIQCIMSKLVTFLFRLTLVGMSARFLKFSRILHPPF